MHTLVCLLTVTTVTTTANGLSRYANMIIKKKNIKNKSKDSYTTPYIILYVSSMRGTQAVGVHNITYFLRGHKYIITCIINNNNNSCTFYTGTITCVYYYIITNNNNMLV